jgi:hypothetical protein
VSDREWNLQADEVFCQAIPDGTLAKVRRGSSWVLFLEWSEGYGRRLLTHGSREQVERYALDVAVHGPPGGPEFRGEETVWRRSDDGTLHAPTVSGEFRLMPLVGGKHLLTFARNDVGVSVIDIGELAELQRTADDRLRGVRGGVITLDIGRERIPLRGVVAGGVLGYVDSFDGAQLLLGHLSGEQFGLFYARGESGECMGLYDLAELRRGGPWAGRLLGAPRPRGCREPCGGPGRTTGRTGGAVRRARSHRRGARGAARAVGGQAQHPVGGTPVARPAPDAARGSDRARREHRT